MNTLVKILKFLGIVLLLAVIAAVLTLAALWLQWPPLTGVVIVAGLCGLVLLVLGLKKLFLWRNKKRFVAHVMRQDATIRDDAGDSASQRPIRQIWEHGMAHLRRSPLRQRANPVYTLPWFLMLGEKNSGKTSLLDQTGGVRPLGEALPRREALSNSVSTEDDSLSWMFLSHAVILEANACYSGSPDASADARDWEEFLALLAAERSREPLNGVLFAISVDRLLGSSGTELADMANKLRNRLMQLTLMLGSRFPVYLIVTRIDLLDGMAELLGRLPEHRRQQTLGSDMDTDFPLPPEMFVRETLAQAEQQLRFALAELAGAGRPPSGDDFRALLELRGLNDNLALFMDVLFRPSPHQPALMPRGLFLTSVLFENGALAAPDPAPKKMPEASPGFLPETSASVPTRVPGQCTGRVTPCFLGELFFRILPGDRNLHRPLEGFWSMKTRMVGVALAGWYLTALCLCGMFALNTLYNWHIFHADTEDATARVVQSLSLNEVYELYVQHVQIQKLEHARKVWWLPTFGLNRIGELEEREIANFRESFRETELYPFLRKMAEHLNKPGHGADEDERFHILQRLMWMAKAVDLRRSEGSADAVFKVPFPVATPHSKDVRDLNVTWNPSFANFYVAYLNRIRNDEELESLASALEKITLPALSTGGVRDFSWLLAGVNHSPQLATVYLEMFVPHRAVPNENSVSIPPAYTAAGYREIAVFMGGLLNVTRGNAEIAMAVERFWKQYHKDYAAAWNEFGFKADNIWNDEFRLEALDDLLPAASKGDTPQVMLLTRMSKELAPLVEAKAAPDWVVNVLLADAIIELTSQRWESHAGSGETSSLAMLYSSMRSSRNPVWSLLTSNLLDVTELRSFFNSSAGLYAYYGDLDRLEKTAASPEASFQLVQAHYGGSRYGKTEESPFTLASKNLESALSLLPTVASDKDVARYVLTSQLRFMAHAIIVRAADALDRIWVSDVVAPAQILPRDGSRDELTALFGEKGLVTEFVAQQATAFLTRDRGGYHPAVWNGQPFPFTEDFLFYIQEGQAGAASPPKDSYTVALRSDPTSVNVNATEKPESTLFTLACRGGAVTLQNDNYPKRMDVVYKPAECQAASLAIRFPSLTLTKQYPDFPAFLNEFLYGERIFTPQDFPEQAEVLTALGVRELMVRILPDNAAAVLAGQNTATPVMPERITFSR